MNNANQIDELKQQCHAVLSNSDSIFLATIDDDGSPMASYAPCWRDEAGYFFVMLSELAEHTRNLRARPNASCLVLGPIAENAFARPRVTLKFNAEFVASNDPSCALAIAGLKQSHGETMEILQELSDFYLIRLKATSGIFVGGFATTLVLNSESTPGLLSA